MTAAAAAVVSVPFVAATQAWDDPQQTAEIVCLFALPVASFALAPVMARVWRVPWCGLWVSLGFAVTIGILYWGSLSGLTSLAVYLNVELPLPRVVEAGAISLLLPPLVFGVLRRAPRQRAPTSP